MIVYFVFLLIAVSLGRCENENECIERYAECAEVVQEMKGAPPCRIISAFMKCFVNATEVCIPSLKDTVQKYKILIDEGCRPGSMFFQDAVGTMECLMGKKDPFRDCKLEGEFNNMADVCLSVESLIDCARTRTETVCGKRRGEVFYKMWKPMKDFFGDCKNSQDAKDNELNACHKGLLNCDRKLLTRGEYTCPEVERIARCYVNVADTHCDLDEDDRRFIKMVKKYVDQIPDYCNPDSSVMKSFTKSSNCILSKYAVLEPCNKRFGNAFTDVIENDHDSKESTIVMARASVEYRNCVEEKLRSACNDEAAFVARYVFEPVVSVAGDACIELTGETCNGAFRMKCTILLLMLCLKYLLTKEDE